MIKANSTHQTVEWEAQLGAAKGLLYCLAHENVVDNKLIYSVAINILFAVAAPLTITLPLIVPIVLGGISVGLLAYNVMNVNHRFKAQKEALRWKPTFELILAGRYGEAYDSYQRNYEWIRQNYYEDRFKEYSPETALYASLCIYHRTEFVVPYLRNQTDMFFENLEFFLSILKELQTEKGTEKSFENIERCVRHMRHTKADLAIQLISKTTEFKASKIENLAQLLFQSMLKELDSINTHIQKVRKSENPKYLPSSSINEQHAKEFIRLLQVYGKGISSEDQQRLDRLLASKDVIELCQIGAQMSKELPI